MSIIEELYNGNIYPPEQVTPETAHTVKEEHELGAAESALCDTLSAPQRELFDEYKTRVSHLSDLYNLEFYREVVRFAAAFLLEAFGPQLPESTDEELDLI